MPWRGWHPQHTEGEQFKKRYAPSAKDLASRDIRTNFDADGEVEDEVVPGLFPAGEAASASVHGARRLGANSLLDIVVFGRACANCIAGIATPRDAIPEAPADMGMDSVVVLDKLRNIEGSGQDSSVPHVQAPGKLEFVPTTNSRNTTQQVVGPAR